MREIWPISHSSHSRLDFCVLTETAVFCRAVIQLNIYARQRAVAQLAEFRSPKPAVGGSNPSCPARHDWKKRGRRVEQEVTHDEKLGLFARIALFYRQVVSELKRVVWPTREQLTTYTSVVLVFVTFIIAVVSIFDLGLTKLVFWIFG